MQLSIHLDSVSRTYNGREIIKNINLKIYKGSIVSLLGTNGAGKSTLIKMILGLEVPSNGKIFLNGFAPSYPKSRTQVGAVLQVSQFVDELTTRETLKMVAKHYPQNMPLSKLIITFSLEEFIDRRIKNLSIGQKRRIALALAFVGNPKVIFLDEPTVGLDVESRIQLWKFIQDYRKPDTTIFLTTHYLEEAESLSDRILLLKDGSITSDGSLKEITKQMNLPVNKSSLQDVFVKLMEG